ncbi:Alcohol O-acetyltransferase [Homalodisca vitripennis]|nr:Alcohol O-acetyltransferase [Homalodisca vitripennis]
MQEIKYLYQNNTTFCYLADQTPTPTRFIRNCEEVGLFQDLQNVNPFEETFRKAVESGKTGTLALQNSRVSVMTDDTLHTPHVFPHIIENDSVCRPELGQKPLSDRAGGEETAAAVEERVGVVRPAVKVVRQEADTSQLRPIAPSLKSSTVLKVIAVSIYHSPAGDPKNFLEALDDILTFISSYRGYSVNSRVSVVTDDTLHTPHVFPHIIENDSVCRPELGQKPLSDRAGGEETAAAVEERVGVVRPAVKVVRQEADTSQLRPIAPSLKSSTVRGSTTTQPVQLILQMPDGRLMQLNATPLDTDKKSELQGPVDLVKMTNYTELEDNQFSFYNFVSYIEWPDVVTTPPNDTQDMVSQKHKTKSSESKGCPCSMRIELRSTKLCMPYYKFGQHDEPYLDPGKITSKSRIERQNNTGPKFDPCDTPDKAQNSEKNSVNLMMSMRCDR